MWLVERKRFSWNGSHSKNIHIMAHGVAISIATVFRIRDSSHEQDVASRSTISSHEEVMCSRLMRIAIRKWRPGYYIKWKFNWSQTIMRCARNHAGQEWHSLCVSAALTPSPPSSLFPPLRCTPLFCNILSRSPSYPPPDSLILVYSRASPCRTY